MGNTNTKSRNTLGFLTVVEQPQHGLFGGFLVLNPSGRPVEFHCTAPIKPNRAQEILYGPTLEAFLYGEQIGRTLIEQAQTAPLLICTDQPPALAAREFVVSPMVLVLPQCEDGPSNDREPSPGQSGQILRLDAAHGRPGLTAFPWGRNRLALPERAEEDRKLVDQRLGELSESFDLAEPFQRIREAIEEAQQQAAR